MKRKIDFIIYESKDERIVFRFYPRKSHVHSFNDEPPKSWAEVYKVYFSYSILLQYKDNPEKTRVVFNEPCDECSVLDELPMLISHILENNITDKNVLVPFGMGTIWELSYRNITQPRWVFSLWRWDNIGYRFSLEENGLIRFKDYLSYVLEYMLQHGEGI